MAGPRPSGTVGGNTKGPAMDVTLNPTVTAWLTSQANTYARNALVVRSTTNTALHHIFDLAVRAGDDCETALDEIYIVTLNTRDGLDAAIDDYDNGCNITAWLNAIGHPTAVETRIELDRLKNALVSIERLAAEGNQPERRLRRISQHVGTVLSLGTDPAEPASSTKTMAEEAAEETERLRARITDLEATVTRMRDDYSAVVDTNRVLTDQLLTAHRVLEVIATTDSDQHGPQRTLRRFQELAAAVGDEHDREGVEL